MITSLISVVLFIRTISVTIIAKSSLDSCTQDSEDVLKCNSKIVLSLTIQNAELENTDYISTYLTNVTDNNGNTKTLTNPYKITISKSSVSVNYNCVYLQDFNYHPTETVIASDIWTCSDGDKASSPTCGWQKDSDGNNIEYSQGFCCQCDLGQIIGTSDETIRGKSCKVLNLGVNSATAHCLRYDELWFSAYEVNSYSLSYTIKVNIINSLNASDYQTLTLTPSNTISSTEDGSIMVKLIGDFLPLDGLPQDYSSYYLLTPSYPESNIFVVEGSLYWMLVKNTMFTLDGRECDKIGSSYFAFKTQGSKCQVSRGSCLNNQIYDLINEDLYLMQNNKSPKYLLSFDTTKKWSFYSYSKLNKKLSYTLSGNINTLITIELKADDIKYVVNVSKGQIDSVIIGNFEAMSNNGIMQVMITNIGKLTATFYLSYSCSENIMPISANELSLSPLESSTIYNKIYTLSSKEYINQCTVTLKNSIGEINDELSVDFNTTEQTNTNNQNGTNSTSNNNSSDNGITTITLTCTEYCPGFWSFACFVVHGCWWYFARTCLVILSVVLAIGLLFGCIKKKFLCKCCKKLHQSQKEKKKKEEKVTNIIQCGGECSQRDESNRVFNKSSQNGKMSYILTPTRNNRSLTKSNTNYYCDYDIEGDRTYSRTPYTMRTKNLFI